MIAPRLLILVVSTLALPIAVLARPRPTPMPLQPVAAFSAISGKARSFALFREMGKVITSPRCMNCHPRSDRPNQGEAGTPHDPPVLRGPDGHGVAGLECSTCHSATNVDFANGTGSIPGNPKWDLAPIAMAWEGKTLQQICRQIRDPRRNGGKTLADLVEHNGTDELVGWAWHPGKGRMPAPGTQRDFGALTKAWVDSGAACDP